VTFWPTPTASQGRNEGMLKQMRAKVLKGELTRTEAEAMVQGSLEPARMKPMEQPIPSSQLTLLPADTHASHLVLPGSEAARKMTATSGRKCLGSWLPSGPVGSLLKMLLGTSTWASTRCFLTWKAKATPHGRLYFQLAPSMPRTDATESGLWHTPSSQEPGVRVERLVTKDGDPARVGERAYDKKTGRLAQVGLTQQVKMWPTLHGFSKDGGKSNGPSGNELGRRVNQSLWPTPRAQARAKCFDRGDDYHSNLEEAVGMTTQGSLNPEWVEWLQGYPKNWTEID